MKSLKSILLCSLLFSVSATYGQGIVSTICGLSSGGFMGDGGPAVQAQLAYPQFGRFDGNGNFYMLVNGVSFRKINTAGIINSIGGQPVLYAINGAPDDSGNVFVAQDHLIIKIDGSPVNTVIAGDGGTTIIDGVLATNTGMTPAFVAVDKHSNIYVSGDNRIRKIDSATHIITTICGDGTSVYGGDGGPAINATLVEPRAMCFDPNGNLYVIDKYRIRKIDTAGIVSLIAGTNLPGSTSSSANISPVDIAADSYGNVLFVEGNKIRMCYHAGGFVNIAGTAGSGWNGDGPANSVTFYTPMGIALDDCENVYISDADNNRLRKITYPHCHDLNTLDVAEVSTVSFSLYPNPATTSLTITSAEQIKHISVCDVFGRVALTHEVNNKKTTLDISGLICGIYFVRMYGAHGDIRTERVMIR